MDRRVKPILKWAGGKGAILPQLLPFFPKKFNSYFEPFIGGGAVFFHIEPANRSQINDINTALINVYAQIKGNTEELIEELSKLEAQFLRLEQNDRRTFYYNIRDRYNNTELASLDSAAFFIFLNRTCFNGLYRENSKGAFNVPFGAYKNPRICDSEGIRKVANSLKHTVISNFGFAEAVETARKGDFVYFDPPYVPLTDTASFTAYSANGFNREAQEELARVYRELDKRGCYVALSNSDTPLVRELYVNYKLNKISAPRNISAHGSKRGKVAELLVTNY